MKTTCETCRFFDGSCRRFPAPIAVKADHWCGEYKDTQSQFNAAPEKFADQELIDAIRYYPGNFLPWRDGCDVLAQRFSVSRRSIEERCKRLEKLEMLDIPRGANGRRDSVFVHPSVTHWEQWVEECKRENKDPNAIRWKQLEAQGVLEPGETKPSERPPSHWTFPKHLLPAMLAIEAHEATPAQFSRLAEKAYELCKIHRAAFSRTLKDAISAGKVIRNQAGLYHLPDEKALDSASP